MAAPPSLRTTFDIHTERALHERFPEPEAQAAAREILGKASKLVDLAEAYRDEKISKQQGRPAAELSPPGLPTRRHDLQAVAKAERVYQSRLERIGTAQENELQRIGRGPYDPPSPPDDKSRTPLKEDPQPTNTVSSKTVLDDRAGLEKSDSKGPLGTAASWSPEERAAKIAERMAQNAAESRADTNVNLRDGSERSLPSSDDKNALDLGASKRSMGTVASWSPEERAAKVAERTALNDAESRADAHVITRDTGSGRTM